MSKKDHASLLAGKAAAVTVASICAVTFAQTASSYSLGSSANAATGETCLYSQQLQKSVAARRQYLVAVGEVTNRADASAVEAMYGNITPASYTTEDADQEEYGILTGYRTKGAEIPELDSFSANCLGCHDGVNATAVGVDLRNSPINKRSRVNSFKSDHPIGMNYNMYVTGSRGFKQVRQDSNMLFVNGKVGCLTCHDPLNQEKGHLVMSDRGSALCVTCHDK